MDRKLIIGGAIGGVLAIAGLAYAVLGGGSKDSPHDSGAPVPAAQLQNEIQPAQGKPGAPVPKMPDGRPLPM